jgi:hypothetical protein
MGENKILICEHCKGTGRCSCDECWNENMFRPDYSQIPSLKWSNKNVPCSACGGRGRIQATEIEGIPDEKD